MARLLVLVALALACAGCTVEATVMIDVDEDGGGTVGVRLTLDADAVRAAEATGTPLESSVRLDGLADAGWEVTPWAREQDGGATMALRKTFARPEELAGVVGELNGADGPLRDVKLRRERSLVRTTLRLSGEADLGAATTGIATDEELVARLAALGVDVAALDAELLAQLRTGVALRVESDLAGRRTDVWDVAPGGRAELAASASVLDERRVVLLGTATLLVGAALAVLVVRRRPPSRRRRSARRAGA